MLDVELVDLLFGNQQEVAEQEENSARIAFCFDDSALRIRDRRNQIEGALTDKSTLRIDNIKVLSICQQ